MLSREEQQQESFNFWSFFVPLKKKRKFATIECHFITNSKSIISFERIVLNERNKWNRKPKWLAKTENTVNGCMRNFHRIKLPNYISREWNKVFSRPKGGKSESMQIKTSKKVVRFNAGVVWMWKKSEILKRWA